MSDPFSFIHEGRTFSCRTEQRPGARGEQWWWFEVSSDDRHRYAPFRAEPTDTPSDVQTRIVTYYEDLVARRALPATSHWRR